MTNAVNIMLKHLFRAAWQPERGKMRIAKSETNGSARQICNKQSINSLGG